MGANRPPPSPARSSRTAPRHGRGATQGFPLPAPDRRARPPPSSAIRRSRWRGGLGRSDRSGAGSFRPIMSQDLARLVEAGTHLVWRPPRIVAVTENAEEIRADGFL